MFDDHGRYVHEVSGEIGVLLTRMLQAAVLIGACVIMGVAVAAAYVG
jgi:hypothetical protein